MTAPDKQRHREEADRRAEHDDPTRDTTRQIDDNQDDLGQDVNRPARPKDGGGKRD